MKSASTSSSPGSRKRLDGLTEGLSAADVSCGVLYTFEIYIERIFVSTSEMIDID